MSATDQSPAEQFLEGFKRDLARLIVEATRDLAPKDRLLTLEEVAERLNISLRTARGLTYRIGGNPPQLPSLKVGTGQGATRVEESQLEAFVERRRVAGEAEA